MHYRNKGSNKEALLLAVEHYRKAIKLDPTLASGHLVLSSIAIGYRLDKATAMKETSKAMAPNGR